MSEHAMSDRFPLQFEWDYWLIILSVIVAFIAAFIALETAGKVSSSDRRGLIFWRIAGGTTMGIGIWSMHFIGMLAMKFPVLILYDVEKTSLSLVLAVISSILSLNLAVSGDVLTKLKLVGSSFLLGGGVVVMHYLGMAATMIYPEISWNLWMVALSIF
ncbi:MHYT domain-containing protein, partial [Pantoea endophytica]